MIFLPNRSVNLRVCLCGVVHYAAAQALDILYWIQHVRADQVIAVLKMLPVE